MESPSHALSAPLCERTSPALQGVFHPPPQSLIWQGAAEVFSFPLSSPRWFPAAAKIGSIPNQPEYSAASPAYHCHRTSLERMRTIWHPKPPRPRNQRPGRSSATSTGTKPRNACYRHSFRPTRVKTNPHHPGKGGSRSRRHGTQQAIFVCPARTEIRPRATASETSAPFWSGMYKPIQNSAWSISTRMTVTPEPISTVPPSAAWRRTSTWGG